MKISFFETERWEERYIKEKLKGCKLEFFKSKLSLRTAKKAADAEIISTFIYSRLNEKIIASLPRLKYIATRSTGFDHIDLNACQKKGILVSNVPNYGENTVAEHTFALILSLSRKICLSNERIKKGIFSPKGLTGFDLKGKTIGIVGVGSIGKCVVKIAKGFGMKVLAYDIKENKALAKKLGFNYVPFEKLLSASDIVSLHVPYNKQTHHLINKRVLKMFKKGAILINTARGGVCETAALLEGIRNGTFSALGLDVLEEECFIKEEREILTASFIKKSCDPKTALVNHILMDEPNVLITPHNAFNSKEALERILKVTLSNIKNFMRGRHVNSVLRRK